MKKLTIEEFVEKARRAHGDKYDYSKVEYVNNQTKVIIICPTHGDFEQQPSNHLKGSNCPKCSGKYSPNTEEFIVKAKEVHGDRYDYSKVVYTDAKIKVIITCPTHGDFLQTPDSHLQGRGCPKCSVAQKRTTNEEFISRSKSIFGEDIFDYSKVEYVNSDTKVTLFCKKHNIEFEQLPKSHIKGQVGCPECFYEKYGRHENGYWTYDRCYETAKKYEWVGDFKKQDETCYNTSIKNSWLKDFTWLKRHYSEDEDILSAKKHCIYKYEFPQFNVVYIGLSIDVKKRYSTGHSKKGTVYIFCKENNIDIPQPQIIEGNLTIEESKDREAFWIDYYKSQGYKLLNKAKAGSVGMLYRIKTGKETDNFIEKAKKVHGNRYNYDKVEYINAITKVSIICRIHGEFKQIPSSHLLGCGCLKCANEKKNGSFGLTKEGFIRKARTVHGKKYDYSKTTYKNNHTKVIITCPTHGDFEQIPNNHFSGQGCPKCYGGHRSNTEEFIEKARRVHGNKFDYSQVEYKNNKSKVTIVCPLHGEFCQKPNNHLQGQGCPKCGDDRRIKANTKWTYEVCKAESKKYKSRSNFNEGSRTAYEISRKSGWLDEFYPKK